MMVMEPDSTNVVSEEEGGLAEFDRFEARCGTVTAIAPVNMVYIDDSLKDPVNLYDGLPIESKVVYLMSTLTSAQWDTATQKGIGLDDLTGEQKAVFLSIIPRPFRYKTYRTVDGAGGMNEAGETVLTDAQANQLRILFSHRLFMEGQRPDKQGWVGLVMAGNNGLKPDQLVNIREPSSTQESTMLFGQLIRKVLPNKLKPSDLNYALPSLDAPVPLAQKATIENVLAAVAKASSINLTADRSLRSHQIRSFGESGRAGDVLRSLAMMVTGTFRKVGSTYELTSDLEGMGAKRIKIGLFYENTRLSQADTLASWANQAKSSPGFSKLGYASWDPYPGTGTVDDWLKKHPTSDEDATLSLTDLPIEMQNGIQKGLLRPGSIRAVDLNHIKPEQRVRFDYLLPDGTPFRFGNTELTTYLFTGGRLSKPDRVEAVPGMELSADKSTALVLRAKNPEEAREAVEIAKVHGFTEIWIESQSVATVEEGIRVAKTAGMAVRLAISPWQMEEGLEGGLVSESDSNIFGDVRAGTPLQPFPAEFHEWFGRFGHPWDDRPSFVASSDSLTAVWSRFAKPSQVPGLAGIVLLNTEPIGYEPSGWLAMTAMSRSVSDALSRGYTQKLREQFLVKEGVDPIDIGDPFINLKLDLSQPFFEGTTISGQGYVESDDNYGPLKRWQILRGEANAAAVESLISQLNQPLIIETRRSIGPGAPVDQPILVTLNPGDKLPQFDGPSYDDTTPRSKVMKMQRVGAYLSPTIAKWCFDNFKRQYNSGSNSVALDLSDTPPSQIPTLLDTWFHRKE
jgi:hypothetical protein